MDGSLGKLISIIHRNLSAYMDRVFSDTDIGHGPRRFLVEIALFPGLTQEEISERLLMDKTTTARAVKQLEQRGYVSRTRNPDDRRQYILRATPEGQRLLPLALEARKQAHIALSEGLSPDEVEAAFSILKRIADNAVKLRVSVNRPPTEKRR
jgi:DNA-binding MarR family transcriptional regulator